MNEDGFRFPIPPHIREIKAYVPGKPEEELMRELGVSRVFKLASNENSFGSSPKAVQAVRDALSKSNRYPDGSGYYLRNALAERHRLPFAQIILGNGSTDLIEVIARTYLQPGSNTVTSEQSFVMYRIATLAAGGKCLMAPMREHRYDLEEIRKLIDENTRIVYMANPNNPTGTMVTRQELAAFLKAVPSQALVVLDEAYSEYVGRDDYPNGLDYQSEHPNVIVLRTFSKIYGLAALRIGYGVACEEIVTNLNRVRSPFNTSALAQAAGLGALEDDDHVRRTVGVNRDERDFLHKELGKMTVPYVPSVTNFVLLPIEDSMNVFNKLLRQGVIVRPMPTFSGKEGLRVTVGRHEENIAFLEALKKALG
jgi:histidinol-phosphate aminotransferase